MTSLTREQEAAVSRFRRLRVAGVFMEQGSGKTRVACELIDYNADRLDFVVWLAPFSTLSNLRAELAIWQPSVPVEIVGFETISQSDRTFLNLLHRMEGRRCMIVADESIFIKNASSKRHQRALRLRQRADYAVCLNGTPVTRDLWDIKRQMDFLSPKIIGMSDGEYRARYFEHVKWKRTGGEAGEFYRAFEPNVAHLRSLIEPYVYEAELHFPFTESERHITVRVSPDTTARYADVKHRTLDHWRETGDGSGVRRMLTAMQEMVANDSHRAGEIGAALRGRYTLVYCTHIREQEIIARASGGFMINGATTPQQREDIIRASCDKGRPLIFTYGTGAYGLNLQHYRELVFTSLPFDYGQVEQAKKRIRRIGQTGDITYTFYHSHLGISNVVWRNLERKGTLADLVRSSIDDMEVAL